MENFEIKFGHWAGKIPAEKIIPHTAYDAGRIIKNKFSEKAKIAKLQYKPSCALSTAHDSGLQKNLFAIHDKTERIVGYVATYANENDEGSDQKIAQDCFILLRLDGPEPVLVINAQYTRCVYYVILAKMLKENKDVVALYTKLCNGLRWNDEQFKDCFFEKNKEATFEKMSDGLYQTINEMFPVGTDNVESCYGYDPKKVRNFINQGYLEDLSGWIHLDQKDKESGLTEYSKSLGVFDENTPIKKTSMPLVDILSKNTDKFKKEDMSDFLTKDWGIMSDEEAEKMPQFLQIQRKAMRNFYEEKKKTLSYEVALKIQEMHDGKLKTLSFSGPTGTGKTFAARMIAGALNLPLQIVVGKAGIDSSEYLGSYQIVSKNGETNSVWKDGAITEVVRYGGVLLFDEINLAEPEVVGSLNTLLDISNCLCLSDGETVPANDKFFYVEAMNIGSGFDGTNKMNNSHRRRMQRKMRFALPTKNEEIAILQDTTGYNTKKILGKLIEVEAYIRQNIEDPTNQYMSISEVQGWISEAEYTGEWVHSACDTILAPLMEQDEAYTDYSIQTITACGGFPFEVLSYIQEVLGEDTYD